MGEIGWMEIGIGMIFGKERCISQARMGRGFWLNRRVNVPLSGAVRIKEDQRKLVVMVL
jgi:hypothetical protein